MNNYTSPSRFGRQLATVGLVTALLTLAPSTSATAGPAPRMMLVEIISR